MYTCVSAAKTQLLQLHNMVFLTVLDWLCNKYISSIPFWCICRSAMFNILIIIALSALLSGQVLNLDWRPLARDSVVYGISIIVFIGFAWDGKLEWYEALILLLIYVAYIIIMKFNSHLLKLLSKIECSWCRYIYITFIICPHTYTACPHHVL